MSDKTPADKMARESVLDFMRGRQAGGNPSASGPAAVRRERSATRRGLSFADLPEYRQVLAHEAAGELLSMANPFYRVHEKDSGSTAVIDGHSLINFSSYDYLGLNRHPLVRERATDAIERYGISASASRLVAGERPVHQSLEAAIAEHYGVDAAVAFVSGYLTNLTTIACLLGPTDLILHDELIHDSAKAGARFSGATRRGFRHNDLEDLERLLTTLGPRYRRILVIVEGLYSMDGDIADLPGLIRLRSTYGFWLMVDEAHSLGVLGASGRGSFEHFGCDPVDIDIWMGTLSKTTASCGGYIAGSKELVAVLKGFAGGFVYSVGLAPALAAAAHAGFEIIADEPLRTARLQENGRHLLDKARAAGLDTGSSIGAAVVPVMVGDSVRAVYLSNALVEVGFNVLPIIFPAVPEGQARLRFFVTSEHTTEQIDSAIEATAGLLHSLTERGIGMSMIDPQHVASYIALHVGDGGKE